MNNTIKTVGAGVLTSGQETMLLHQYTARNHKLYIPWLLVTYTIGSCRPINEIHEFMEWKIPIHYLIIW